MHPTPPASVIPSRQGSPYVGSVLDAAFSNAQAVVVLMTPDDIAHLRPELAGDRDEAETTPTGQARPNVLFEAGMALGRHPDRTILVECGALRPFSDIGGRHTVRLNNSLARREDLVQRLQTAGCDVRPSDTSWHEVGNLDPTMLTASVAIGQRLAEAPKPKKRVVLDAQYQQEGDGQGKLAIINRGTETVHHINVRWPKGDPAVSVLGVTLPIDMLPAGKHVRLPAMKSLGGGVVTHATITLTGETDDGEQVEQDVFISLM